MSNLASGYDAGAWTRKFSRDLAMGSDRISNEKRVNLLTHTGEIIAKQIKFAGLDQQAFDHSKSQVENTLKLMAQQNDTQSLLSLLSEHDDLTYIHSVGVSMIGAMIAKQMGWRSHDVLFKITMGGLFHDIGTKEIDQSILKKPRKDLNAEETKAMESVPMRGLEILGGIKSIPGDVIQIAYQHHENCIGMGFPRGLTGTHIHPMARLIAVANEFCNLAMKTSSGEAIDPKEAVGRLHQMSGGRLDATALGALAALFK